MLGLTGAYAWSAMSGQAPLAQRPGRAGEPEAATLQAAHYSGCNDVGAEDKAPLHEGEPGYRVEMDGDGDGIACEARRIG